MFSKVDASKILGDREAAIVSGLLAVYGEVVPDLAKLTHGSDDGGEIVQTLPPKDNQRFPLQVTAMGMTRTTKSGVQRHCSPCVPDCESADLRSICSFKLGSLVANVGCGRSPNEC